MHQIDPYYEDTIPFHDDDKSDASSTPEYTLMPLHKQHEPTFTLPHSIDPTVEFLISLAIPDSLIDNILKYTNIYATVYLGKNKFKQATKDKTFTLFCPVLLNRVGGYTN